MNKKAFLAVLISAIIAGASGVFIKSVSMPATSIAFIRAITPTILVGGFLLYSGTNLFRGDYKLMLAGSALNVVRIYLYFVAFIYTTIANAIIIEFSWPIFVTIFSVLFLKEKVARKNIGLLMLAFLGIIIVFANHEFSFENKDMIGMLAAICVAITYATTVIIFKKGTAHYNQWEIIFFQNVVGAFVFLPLFFLHQPFPPTWEIGTIFSYAVLMGIIGFSLFFYGLKHLKASTAAMLTYLEVVSALCFGFFLLGEPLTWNVVVGGIIIIVTTASLQKT